MADTQKRNPLLGPPDLDEERPGAEIGTSKVLPIGDEWAVFLDEAERTPDLVFPRSIETFHAMRTDSQIDSLHIGTVSPIKEFRWSVDANGAKAKIAEAAAADLGLPLKGEEDEPIPRARNAFVWDDFLADALLAPLYGFFDFEAVGEVVEGQEWRLSKASPRHPRLTEAFRENDAGDLTAIRQRVAGPKTGGLGMPEPIPADRLIRFVWRGEANSHVGRSMLRSMFREWSIKDRTMRIAAINLQRAGGIPVITGAPGMGNDQLIDLAAMARQFKVSEGGGGSIPFGTNLNLVGGSVPDAISLLKYCDEAMARVWALMLVQLGMTATGNRALGAEFAIYAARAQRAWAKWIKASVDSLLDRYVEWNDPFATHAPLINFEQAKPDALSLADLVALVGAGLLTVDPELEEWLRAETGLPEKPEEPEEPESPPPVVIGPDGQPVAPGAPVPAGPATVPSTGREPSVDQPTLARGGAHAHPLGVERVYGGIRASLTLPARELRRPPSANEIRAAVDFKGLDTAHTTVTTSLQQRWLKDVTPEQIKAMGDQIRGITGDLTRSAVLDVQAPALGGELLQGHLTDAAVSGATAAKREMMAQGKPSEHVVRVPDTPGALAPRVADQAAAMARLNANAITLAAQRKAASLVSEGGRSKAEVAAAMESHLVGQKHVWEREQLRGAVTMAQNQGRIAAFESQPNAAEATYEASELLDNATCEPCEAIDGTVFESLEEAEEAYAGGGYVDCEGGPNCRGTLVAVYPEQNPETGPGPLSESGEPYTSPEPGDGAPTPEMIREPEAPGVPAAAEVALNAFASVEAEPVDAALARENLEVVSTTGLTNVESAWGQKALDEEAMVKRRLAEHEREQVVVSAHDVHPVMAKVNKLNVSQAIDTAERNAALGDSRGKLFGARLDDGRIAILRTQTGEATAQILGGKDKLAVEIIEHWTQAAGPERLAEMLKAIESAPDLASAAKAFDGTIATPEHAVALGRHVMRQVDDRLGPLIAEHLERTLAAEEVKDVAQTELETAVAEFRTARNAALERGDDMEGFFVGERALAAFREDPSSVVPEVGRYVEAEDRWLKASNELHAIEKAEPNPVDVLPEILGQAREMGGSFDVGLPKAATYKAASDASLGRKTLPKATKAAAKIIRDGMDLVGSRMPTAWIDASNAAGKIEPVMAKGAEQRAFHIGLVDEHTLLPNAEGWDVRIGGGRIYGSARKWGDGDNGSTILHELTHRMQGVVPDLQRLEGEFWKARTADDPRGVTKLSELTKNTEYGPDEVAIEDRFTDPYTGKMQRTPTYEQRDDGTVHYSTNTVSQSGGVEVGTMGMQGLYFGENSTLTKDRELAEFIAGVVAGL